MKAYLCAGYESMTESSLEICEQIRQTLEKPRDGEPGSLPWVFGAANPTYNKML